jgi:hypothetical protein
MKKKKLKTQNNDEELIIAINLMNNSLSLLKKSLSIYNNIIQKGLIKKLNACSQNLNTNCNDLNGSLDSKEKINSSIVDANYLDLLIE